MLVEPTVISSSVEITKPESALVEPSSTKKKAPAVTSASESKSVALAGEAPAVYTPVSYTHLTLPTICSV